MRLLLAEDNPADARLVREMLNEAPAGSFEVEHVDRLEPARIRLRTAAFDAVLLDLGLPDSQGMETLALAQATDRALPIVVLTGLDDERFAQDVVRAGAQDYLVKGRFSGDMLIRTIRYAVERKHAGDEIRRLNVELERRVAERTAELAAANRELESFAYSVSHDLRAPLRSIDGFSRILLRDCGSVLDAQGRANLERVRQASQRMGELIDNLLELSRTTRADLRRRPVDLAVIAEAVIDALRRAEPERSVLWVCPAPQPAVGDPVLLRAVMENLLGNAWKFTGRRAQARIEFGVTQQAGEDVFYVRDDGAGFDMAYADKLFGPFQRLHSPGEFPGTGIGLATVQRIIRRHGGRIWAESSVDAGSTFYFTLLPRSER